VRILVVAPGPHFSVADVQRGWTKALARLGHDVRTYNLDDRMAVWGAAEIGGHKIDPETALRWAIEPLGAACYLWWPDIIFIVSGFFITDDLWEAWKTRTHKTVLLCTESPYEDSGQFEKVANYEPDVVLLNDPQNLEVFWTIHKKCVYVPHAYDPEIHSPGPALPEWASDHVFVGTAYRSRLDFYSRCDWRDIDLKLAGNWGQAEGTCLERFVIHPIDQCFENADAVHLYRSTKVGANLYRARGTEGVGEAGDESLVEGVACGPREIELAATRTFFLREPRAEGDRLFPFLPTFTEPAEFGELLRYYLKHDEQREDAARRAQEAIADRTFDAHARRLMQLLDD
jgi:hypothetical protein